MADGQRLNRITFINNPGGATLPQNSNDMRTISELIKRVNLDILKLDELANIYQEKEGWIVESEHHVNVDGNMLGLNGTSFNVKGAYVSCNAKVFETREEAEKHGVDYYLVYGNGEPIDMRITKAGKFFKRELESMVNLLSTLDVYLKNNNE